MARSRWRSSQQKAIDAKVKARVKGLRVGNATVAEVLKNEPKLDAFAYRMAMARQHLDEPEKVPPWFRRDSPGCAPVPDLQPLPREAAFDKITTSSFEGTPLTITLRDCGVSAIAIAGIATEVVNLRDQSPHRAASANGGRTIVPEPGR